MGGKEEPRRSAWGGEKKKRKKQRNASAKGGSPHVTTSGTAPRYASEKETLAVRHHTPTPEQRGEANLVLSQGHK